MCPARDPWTLGHVLLVAYPRGPHPNLEGPLQSELALVLAVAVLPVEEGVAVAIEVALELTDACDTREAPGLFLCFLRKGVHQRTGPRLLP